LLNQLRLAFTRTLRPVETSHRDSSTSTNYGQQLLYLAAPSSQLAACSLQLAACSSQMPRQCYILANRSSSASRWTDLSSAGREQQPIFVQEHERRRAI
jgi:hypothetical protein